MGIFFNMHVAAQRPAAATPGAVPVPANFRMPFLDSGMRTADGRGRPSEFLLIIQSKFSTGRCQHGNCMKVSFSG
jgi:hypothetical protein